MNISTRDQQIIYANFLDASISAVQTAKDLGLKPYTVRRTLERLTARGIIRCAPLLNVYALGLAHYGVFFSLATSTRDLHRELIKYLIQSQQVAFLMEVGGEFQYGLSICARTLDDVVRFLDELSKKFEAIFFHKSIAIRVRLTHYGPKYLRHKRAIRKTLEWGIGVKRHQIDRFDHELIRYISRHGVAALQQISNALNAPPMTISYRLKRLRENGILLNSIYIIDTDKVEMSSYYLLIYTRSTHHGFGQRLLSYCADHPNILFVVENLGSWDYELGLHVEHPRTVAEISQELCDKFADQILTIQSMPVFEYRKVMNYPFTDFELAQ